MKPGYLLGGVLLGLFTLLQLLQLLGVLGIGPSLAGFGITILAGCGTFACFAKAREPRG